MQHGLSLHMPVCMLDTLVIPTKTAEPIEVTYAVWTRGVQGTAYQMGMGCTLAPPGEYD